MYSGKKISVAIATYNGEKYIKEQLRSILAQTVQPDEIIISDDGSTDGTIGVIKSIIEAEDSGNIEWILVNNDQRHGYTGNFEHALSCSSGDYTFFCDQDDVWMENKVQHVLQAFLNHPDAWLICHDAIMVDADMQAIHTLFAPDFPRSGITERRGELFRFDQKTFLAKSVTSTFPGMVMCLSRECVENIMPVPRMNGHDTWAFFCAMCEERAYYLPEALTYYRIHGTNVSSPVESRRSLAHRLKKYRKMLSKPSSYSAPLYAQSSAMLKRLEKYGIDKDQKAFQKANAMFVMSSQMRKAEQSGRIKGAALLLRLHLRNDLYHAVGVRQFTAHLMNILLFSKKERRNYLEQ